MHRRIACAMALVLGVGPSCYEDDSLSVDLERPVATISVGPSSRILSVSSGTSSLGTFTATLRDSLDNQLVNRPLTWTSTDTAVAQIVSTRDAVVWVRGLRVGSATVRATSEGKTGEAGVTVTP